MGETASERSTGRERTERERNRKREEYQSDSFLSLIFFISFHSLFSLLLSFFSLLEGVFSRLSPSALPKSTLTTSITQRLRCLQPVATSLSFIPHLSCLPPSFPPLFGIQGVRLFSSVFSDSVSKFQHRSKLNELMMKVMLPRQQFQCKK